MIGVTQALFPLIKLMTLITQSNSELELYTVDLLRACELLASATQISGELKMTRLYLTHLQDGRQSWDIA